MDHLREELHRVVMFLQPYLSLANSHTVDFIVNDSWRHVIPENIRIQEDSNGIQSILNDFYNNSSESSIKRFINEASKYDLRYTDFCKNREHFLNTSSPKISVKITEYMSEKKLHEVESMSEFVANVASLSDTSLIIDIGSGKGYLTSVLALQHNLKILGIDCSQTNINGATKTTMKLEKKWKVYERKTLQIPKNKVPPQTTKEPCPTNEEYYNKYKWKSAIVGGLYKQRVQCISKKTDVSSILHEEYPRENHQNVLLVGLHTCGNLAPSCLELFLANRHHIKSIVNIGCCYHLLEEKFASNPDWLRRNPASGENTFPMSEYLVNQRFALGRDARMCGTQKPLDLCNESEITNATKPLFYRALLQKLLTDNLTPDNLPQGITGRIAHKCTTFPEYVTKALNKLNVHLHLNHENLELFVEKNTLHWERMKLFFILKSALSPIIETVILLDRLLYLHEQDITNSFIVRLFDPFISPRCYAIVALPSGVGSTVI